MMRRGETVRAFGVALGAVLALALSTTRSARAAVPNVLTEQGRLFDTTNKPIQGALAFAFTIYDTPTGDNVLWTESVPDVLLSDGYFSVQVGSVTPIPSSVFDGSIRYLGIAIGSDAEMSPRQAITSVAYAIVSDNATGDITPTSVSINGKQVIDEKGKWVGSTSGLAGPAGPVGPAGPAGTQGPAGETGPAGMPGLPGANGAPGQSVVGESEPPGANCVAGGAKFTSASGVNYACNGDPGGSMGPMGPMGPTGPAGESVIGESEGPGANCATGGTKLTAGTSITYVCNGATGPAGTGGTAGPMGATGPMGPTGPMGETGPAGAAGPMGATGPIGVTGPAGAVGATGAAGPIGATGPAGAVGPIGATGPAGVAGPIGPTGPAGAVGPSGATGAVGPTGAAGPTGLTGAVGPTGPAGSSGATGAAGPTGPTGAAGPAGATGPAGAIGPTGPQGTAGQSVVGSSEPSGPNCAYGGVKLVAASGTTYVCNGAPGATGTAGAVGATGATGPTGPVGATGARGPAGGASFSANHTLGFISASGSPQFMNPGNNATPQLTENATVAGQIMPTACSVGIHVVLFDFPQSFAETFTVRVATSSAGSAPSAFSNTVAACTVPAGTYSCVSAVTAAIAADSILDVALTFSGTFTNPQHAAIGLTCL
ncbi:MAG TPA: hypothetical protein VER96_37600 [Polyangiaceae bacterium]|nr:hypothetical protein [Polyangiaceae bacterium]